VSHLFPGAVHHVVVRRRPGILKNAKYAKVRVCEGPGSAVQA
jgi:hypothetical protein